MFKFNNNSVNQLGLSQKIFWSEHDTSIAKPGCSDQNYRLGFVLQAQPIIAILNKLRYTLCPMPYALCPMSYGGEHLMLGSKGYNLCRYCFFFFSF
jgi:hypothetical protein